MRSENIIQKLMHTSGIFQCRKLRGRALSIIFILSILFLFLSDFGHAELFDKIAAFVDDEAILLSEFDAYYRIISKFIPDIKKEDVINTMINRTLLLKEAKKFRIEGATKEEIIREYIEIKLKALIKINEPDIKNFYENNKAQFGKVGFDSVREQIEQYLTEKEINSVLEQQIKELRSKAHIKINLRFQ